MFKNKIKYSLLVGSLYNVKCNFIFNVYIDGKKTELTKTLTFEKIKKYKENGRDEGDISLNSYDTQLKDNGSYEFGDHILWCVFFEYMDKDCEVLAEDKKILKDKIFSECKIGSTIYNYSQLGYESVFKAKQSTNTTINVYYVSEVQYKILNEDEIKGYENRYSEKNWKIIENKLTYFSKKKKRLTYRQLMEYLKWANVGISPNGGKIWSSIEESTLDDYISDQNAQRIMLNPKWEYYEPTDTTITLEGGKNIKITSRKNVKISELLSIFDTHRLSNDSFGWSSNDKKTFLLNSRNYFEFYDKNGKKLENSNLVQEKMTCKNVKYEVCFAKQDKNKNLTFFNTYDVNKVDLTSEIEKVKNKNGLSDYKTEIHTMWYNDSWEKDEDYENYLSYKLLVMFVEQDKPTEEEPTDDPTKFNPTGDKPTDNQEVVKKTALINECKDLVNKIKALDSSYDKTINGSDSVENLETLKTELTNKLDELKKEEPKPTEVPENPNPINTEPTSTNGGNNSTDGGNTEKNNGEKMCGNCCRENNKTK